MKKLLDLLLLFLRPAIGEGEETTSSETTTEETGAQETIEQSTDLELNFEGGGEETTAATTEDPKAELERERAARAEDRARADRFERELAELRAARPREAQVVDQQTRNEDAILADPNSTDLQKWQVQANRELRAGRTQAQAALMQAQDVNDRTAFAQVAIKNAPLFKKYEARVEEELAKMRSNGQNAPRQAILNFLLGQDMMEGKFAKKAAPASSGAANVNRGKLPGARSDVSGRTGMSEHEKRMKRLENVQI